MFYSLFSLYHLIFGNSISNQQQLLTHDSKHNEIQVKIHAKQDLHDFMHALLNHHLVI